MNDKAQLSIIVILCVAVSILSYKAIDDSLWQQIDSLKHIRPQHSFIFQTEGTWLKELLFIQVAGWVVYVCLIAMGAMWLHIKKITKFNQELATNSLGIAERLATQLIQKTGT